ncbi:MAG: Gfo/Idh/MocA family oxidoreductase [Bryobacteraceae bacterium]
MRDQQAVAIIGCGLIGTKRAQAVGDCRVRVCCDTVIARAEGLAAKFPGAEASSDWRTAATHPEVNIVIVATTHNQLAVIAETAASAGKHVLIEKPGARRASELEPALREAQRTRVAVRVGFNHRYHRALQEARRIFLTGALGEMMFVRGRYGHGGRVGYDREWRADPQASGGGELLDQGVHLIDLARWFLGDFERVQGHIGTYFWDMPVEDNAFLILTTPAGKTALLHATWTEWKNLFSLEIYGRLGKLEISGLGGSYGVERLAFYRMLPQMGPPETTIWEYPMADNSWDSEFADFLEDIHLRREPSPGIRDAQAALRIVENVYAGVSR